jgi:hypothetical protein
LKISAWIVKIWFLTVCCALVGLGLASQAARGLDPEHHQAGRVPLVSIKLGRVPRPGSAYRRRGYQDGLLGALHDVDHKHRADPSNHREYQEPNVPYEAIEAYRDGYERGYDEAMRALAGMPENSSRGGDVSVRGYHDGASGALRDWDHHRRADPNNRNEYRNPHVVSELRSAYREAFRRGYAHIASLIYGGSRD